MHRPLCRLAVVAVSLTATIAVAAEEPPIVWDLRPLYADDAAWEAERAALAKDIPSLATLRGHLQDGPSLLASLDRIWAVKRRLTRLDVYASLNADIDTRDQAAQAREQQSQDLASGLDSATAFLKPEIAHLGKARVTAMLAATPGLAKDRYQLALILREADHTLGREAESVLANAESPLGQPGTIYKLLANADIPWPSIDIRGEKVLLDQEGYVAHRSDRDPAVRAQVFQTFWPVFKTYERTFGATLTANVRGTVFVEKARKYPDALAGVLAQNDVPESVYRTLIAETHRGLPTLHRYLRDAKKLLGLPEFRYSDLYVPFADPPRHYSLGEAETLIAQAVKPLGEDYGRDLAAGFQGAWMHGLVLPGKSSGAYMNGDAYDVHPYVLLSFSGDYESVSTVAHEFGHAMHTVLANRAQPYETSNYPIFIAEIPSTTNEMLLADFVVAHSQTKAEKLYALSQELELLRGTFFRQAMFAEFEAQTHDAIDRGEALTGEALSKIYLALLKTYMGDAEGVMHIDDLYGIEWAYIPHFYNDFYVYQYATSISAAAYFATGIEQGDPALRGRYLDMLKAGGSASPYDTVKRAGPDLASPVPYRALVARMDTLLDQLEAVMAEAN